MSDVCPCTPQASLPDSFFVLFCFVFPKLSLSSVLKICLPFIFLCYPSLLEAFSLKTV